MYKLLFSFLFLTIITSCTVQEEPLTDPHVTAEIANIFAEKMKHKEDLYFVDATMYHDRYLNRIRLDFATQRMLTMCEARELLVDVAHDFINHANTGKLYPFLATGTFSSENLEIYIKCESFYSRYVDPRMMGFFFLRDGLSHFYAADTLNCERACWHYRREYFWQSEDFVEYTRQGHEMYKNLEDEESIKLKKERANSWISFDNN